MKSSFSEPSCLDAEFQTIEFEVTKRHHLKKWLRQERLLRLTPVAVENVKVTGEVTRRHQYEMVSNVRLVDQSYLVITYRDDHDFHYITPHAIQIAWEINRRVKHGVTRDRFQRSLRLQRRRLGSVSDRTVRDAFHSSGVPLPPALDSDLDKRRRQREGLLEFELTELLMDKAGEVGRAVNAGRARVDQQLRQSEESGPALLYGIRSELHELRERIHAWLLARAVEVDGTDCDRTASRGSNTRRTSSPAPQSLTSDFPAPPSFVISDTDAAVMLQVDSPKDDDLGQRNHTGIEIEPLDAVSPATAATQQQQQCSFDPCVNLGTPTSPPSPGPATPGVGGSAAVAASRPARRRAGAVARLATPPPAPGCVGRRSVPPLTESSCATLAAAAANASVSTVSQALGSPSTSSMALRVHRRRRRGKLDRPLVLMSWARGGDGTSEEIMSAVEVVLQRLLLRPRCDRLLSELHRDDRLREKCARVQSVIGQVRGKGPAFFQVPPRHSDIDLGAAISELNTLSEAHAPCEKAEVLVMTAKQICIACTVPPVASSGSMGATAKSDTGTEVTLDELLPLLMMCITETSIEDHVIQSEYLLCLYDSSSADEYVYYQTVYASAIEFLAVMNVHTGECEQQMPDSASSASSRGSPVPNESTATRGSAAQAATDAQRSAALAVAEILTADDTIAAVGVPEDGIVVCN
eukprot:TRINITY_DN6109_c0_g1_i1.p1 TRINITY_DN6109_c0_g1~~TRINITY_DN6109_c0_g1_i1.p1  ORF type:complete len:694 (+),score=133.15 TRINITY_DN6109_c0_g1_i1:79-2160(+)